MIEENGGYAVWVTELFHFVIINASFQFIWDNFLKIRKFLASLGDRKVSLQIKGLPDKPVELEYMTFPEKTK